MVTPPKIFSHSSVLEENKERGWPVTSPTEGGSRGASPPAFTRTTGTSKSPSEAVFIMRQPAVRYGIIMVLSPAKTMDLRPMSKRDFTHDDGSAATIISRMMHGEMMMSELCDQSTTSKIVSVMKSKTVNELRSLLHLSDKLANVANQQWSDFSITPPRSNNNSSNNNNSKNNKEQSHYRPAMFTFSGPAYQGLSPNTCNNTAALNYLASRLFIIDPVYGVLRSLQHMCPYRLEMNCKLPLLSIHQEDMTDTTSVASTTTTATTATLSSYWKSHVTSYLVKELTNIHEGGAGGGLLSNDQQQEHQQQRHRPILVNLASEEYSSCIDKTALLPSNAIYVNVIFKHTRKVVSSVHAKRARGLMARYLADVNASTLEDISAFYREGYSCVECANGKMWEEEGKTKKKKKKKKDTTMTTTTKEKGSGDDDDDIDDDYGGVTVVRMIFDRNCAPPTTKVTKSGAVTVANKKQKASSG